MQYKQNDDDGDRYRKTQKRQNIIPYLETRMNLDFRGSLVRMAGALRADDRLLDEAAGTVPLEFDGDASARLPAPLLSTLPESVAAPDFPTVQLLLSDCHSATHRIRVQAGIRGASGPSMRGPCIGACELEGPGSPHARG